MINGAAGAVGSLVGQIAKIKGCRVVGQSNESNQGCPLTIGSPDCFHFKIIGFLF